VEDVLRRLLASIDDLGDLAQIHRTTAEDADDHIADFFGGFEEGTGFDEDFVVACGETTGAELTIRLLQHRHEACGAQIAAGELHGIEHHSHGATRTAEQRRLGHERHLFDRFIHLRGQTTQREVIVAGAVKGEREDGHVVDALRLHDGHRDAHWHAVEVRAQLFGELHQAALGVLAHFEAHDDEALAVA
jgi:hypothetical protein